MPLEYKFYNCSFLTLSFTFPHSAPPFCVLPVISAFFRAVSFYDLLRRELSWICLQMKSSRHGILAPSLVLSSNNVLFLSFPTYCCSFYLCHIKIVPGIVKQMWKVFFHLCFVFLGKHQKWEHNDVTHMNLKETFHLAKLNKTNKNLLNFKVILMQSKRMGKLVNLLH